MGMMVGANDQGVSLAQIIADAFVAISTNMTVPMLTFLSAGIVNFFVPSGGGQWAVQAPAMMPAAAEMGVSASRCAMGIAWGDCWTNLIQPFWALPALAIAGLKARDIMGYLVVLTVVVGIIVCLGFVVWAMVYDQQACCCSTKICMRKKRSAEAFLFSFFGEQRQCRSKKTGGRPPRKERESGIAGRSSVWYNMLYTKRWWA